MTKSTARRIAWPMLVLSVTLPIAGLLMGSDAHNASTVSEIAVLVTFSVFVLSFAVTGLILATRLPRNPLGWLFSGAALAWGLAAFSLVYAENAVREELPIGIVAGLVTNSGWGVGIALATAFPFLLFPSGTFLSSAWKWLSHLGAVTIVLYVASVVFRPGLIPDQSVKNPVGLGNDPAPFDFLNGLTLIAILLVALGGVVSLIIRFRPSHSEQRQQIKFLLYAGLLVVTGLVIGGIIESQGSQSETAVNYTNAFTTLVLCAIPIGMAIAVLKYRLYDIDVVINKTIVFGVLASFITAVYVAIVVGIGSLLGSPDEPNLALSIAATAIVAIAFSPVKERTQRIANRLVYGHRLSPYEVLSDLARTVATAPTPADVLQGVAQAAAAGVNATGASVTLAMADGKPIRATYPEQELHDPEPASARAEIWHEHERLGDLIVNKPAADPMTPHDRALLHDLASQAGLALHNARLALELQARLEEISAQADELQSSRARIVSAADDSRRQLEKEITEGPRRALVALGQGLEEVRPLVKKNLQEAASAIESLTTDANETLDALRELARGIYPPLLADRGLVEALEAHVRKHDLPVSVEVGPGIRDVRLEESTETAAYFCCLQVLKTAAGESRIALESGSGQLTIAIDPVSIGEPERVSLVDRVEAAAGSVRATDSSIRIALPARSSELVT